jgi:ABC-type Fe3+-hydroxamate transport system substrate-binding protein
VRADRALGFLLTAVAITLAGCGGGAGFPSHPTRLVTDGEFGTDAMVALGFHPVAAVGLPAGGWPPALAPYMSGVGDLLGSQPGDADNLVALSAANPDVIIAPVSLKQDGLGEQLARTAPTFYYQSASQVSLGPGEVPTSTWQANLNALADALGLSARAKLVTATLDLRAAAIRAQVAGKTVALMRIVSPTTFSTVNDDKAVAAVYEHDLGLRNVHLKPQQYPYGCAPAPDPPKACATNGLYVGIASTMTGADALLLEGGSGGRATVGAFEHNAYVRNLRAFEAGHVAWTSSYEELGPIGVGFEYSAIAHAFGLDEYHAALPGDGDLDLTLDPATRRLCWATTVPASLSIEMTGTAPFPLVSASASEGRCDVVSSALVAGLDRRRAARVVLGSGHSVPLESGALSAVDA